MTVKQISDHIQISIHAPREGCDYYKKSEGFRHIISIHAPREGCDTSLV